jgi:hypothetical protein
METQIATTNSNGSLASLAHSLANVGTTTKAFIIAHPISMAAAGGALLGIIAYRSITKRQDRKKSIATQETTPSTI